MAVQQKDLQILQLLCTSPIDANLRTRKGDTPYMLSCMNGSYDCGDYLIGQGADPYLLSSSGQSCLAILANSIRQAANDLDFAFSAQKMLDFVDSYKLEYFGDLNAYNNDIATLNDLSKKAKDHGMVMPAPEPESEPEPEPEPEPIPTSKSMEVSSPIPTAVGVATHGGQSIQQNGSSMYNEVPQSVYEAESKLVE